MKKIALLTALLLSANVGAASISLEHGVFTKHLKKDIENNERNNLNAVEIRGERHGFNVSSFVNTWGNDSLTIGGFYNVADYKYAELDLMYGTVKGYTKEQIKTVCTGEWCAYVAPRVTLKYDFNSKITGKVSAMLFGRAVILTIGARYAF